MSLPKEVRKEVSEVLWGEADRLDWRALSPQEKTQRYAAWTADPRLGGRLARYMTTAQARLFIKDALMKEYSRNKQSDSSGILALLEIPNTTPVERTFTRPAGIELSGKRIVCWGRAINWKLVLLSCFERSYETRGAHPYGVVLLESGRHFSGKAARAPVEKAAQLLGVAKIIWSQQ